MLTTYTENQNRFLTHYIAAYRDNDPSDAHALSQEAALMVNTFSPGAAKLVETMLVDDDVREPFLELSLAWVEQLAAIYDEQSYDDRNEYACRVGAAIVALPAFAPYKNSEVSEVAKQFAKRFRHEHRTLQQTFSGVVFRFLQATLPQGTLHDDDTSGVFGCSDWYRTPLI